MKLRLEFTIHQGESNFRFPFNIFLPMAPFFVQLSIIDITIIMVLFVVALPCNSFAVGIAVSLVKCLVAKLLVASAYYLIECNVNTFLFFVHFSLYLSLSIFVSSCCHFSDCVGYLFVVCIHFVILYSFCIVSFGFVSYRVDIVRISCMSGHT